MGKNQYDFLLTSGLCCSVRSLNSTQPPVMATTVTDSTCTYPVNIKIIMLTYFTWQHKFDDKALFNDDGFLMIKKK